MSRYDCHCHFAFYSPEKLKSLMDNSPKDLVRVMGGYSPEDWLAQEKIKEQHPGLFYSAYGLHPWYVRSSEFELQTSLDQLKTHVDRADLIGEVGLDYSENGMDLKKEFQLHAFETQLDLGYDRPYVFHIVQAHGPALNLLKDYQVKGFVHGFSGALEVAEAYWDLGICLSFGPQILNPQFKKARHVLKEIPLSFLLLESDAPQNQDDKVDPTFLYYQVVREVALVKGLSEEEVTLQVAQNIEKLLPQALGKA